MLLLVALIATFNLCVGYALGVYVGEFPGLPSRKPVDPPEPALDLNTPRKRRRRKRKTNPDDAAMEADAPPSPPGAAPDAAEASAPSPEATAEEPAKSDDKPLPSSQQIMDGMAAFQAQLARMGAEMQAAADDEAGFGDCASRLQQANHDYLEQTQHTIEELDSAPSSEAVGECRDALAENAKRVGETSDEIDSLLADGVSDGAAREAIIAKTGELERVVEAAESSLEARIATGADAPTEVDGAEAGEEADNTQAGRAKEEDQAHVGDDLMAGLATLATAQKAVRAALESGSQDIVVATLRRDPVETPNAEEADDIETRLLTAIADIASECTEATHIVAPQDADRLLMVLTGDTVEKASSRIEKLRQQVEKTNFMAGKTKLPATVTCALAESLEDLTEEDLFANLDEALDQSETDGRNRSYLHDGHFPGPIAAEDASVTMRTVTL